MPAALILYCSQVEEQVTTVGTDGSGVVIASRAGFVWRLGGEGGSDAAWSPATGTMAPLKDHVLQVGLLLLRCTFANLLVLVAFVVLEGRTPYFAECLVCEQYLLLAICFCHPSLLYLYAGLHCSVYCTGHSSLHRSLLVVPH